MNCFKVTADYWPKNHQHFTASFKRFTEEIFYGELLKNQTHGATDCVQIISQRYRQSSLFLLVCLAVLTCG